MTLEFIALLAFVGLLTIRVMVGSGGVLTEFKEAAPSLGARIEAQMTTGRCFNIGQNGATPCVSTLSWQ